MAKGKQTCKILKEIRKQIAEENDIKLVIEECTYQGDCLGTCPKCEAEVRYLERELEKRQRMGKAAVFAGMSLGTLFTATGCDTFTPHPLEGNPVAPDTTEMQNPNDTVSNDTLLFKSDVLALVPDTMKAEDKKTACKKDEQLEIVGGIEDENFVEPNRLNDTLDEGDEIIEGYIPPAIDESDEPEVYMIVEQMPEFPGGEAELLGFISRNIHYPEEAKKKGIQGRVFIGFIIEKDGSVSNVRNLRGVNSELDAEAMRVVKSMPKWKPGIQNGEAVRVSYLIPINFKLEDQQD